MTAAKLDPARCRHYANLIRSRQALLAAERVEIDDQLTAAAELADEDARLQARLAAATAQRLESTAPQTVGIGPADTAIIDEALAYYRSHPASPLEDIARIRALLASPGGGS